MLLWLPPKQQLAKTHSTTKLGRGTDTPNGASSLDWERTLWNVPTAENWNHGSFCHGYTSRVIFTMKWWSPGWNNSHRYPQPCTFRENGGNDPKKDAKNIVVQLLQRQLRGHKKRWPKGDATKSLALLRPPPNPLFQIHGSQTSDGQASSCRQFLGRAFVQILKRSQSQTETK